MGLHDHMWAPLSQVMNDLCHNPSKLGTKENGTHNLGSFQRLYRNTIADFNPKWKIPDFTEINA